MARRDEVEALLSPRFVDSGFCGFWPVDGWLDLIVETHEALLSNPNYRIVQVKEKFGGLCFYTQGLTDSEYGFVKSQEERSLGTCQQCGTTESVDLRRHGWYATLCEHCDSPSSNRGYHYDS